MATCVACDETGISDNHHCDPIREQRIEDARKSHAELGFLRTPTYIERLADGFKTARMAGDA